MQTLKQKPKSKQKTKTPNRNKQNMLKFIKYESFNPLEPFI